jgi:signal transduction histidine kinase
VSDVLREVPMLAELSDSYLKALGWGTHEIRLRPGEALFDEGEPAHDFYYLLEGELEFFRRGEAGERVRHSLAVGALAGQLALVPGSVHIVSARAVVSTRVLALPMEAMRGLLNATMEAGARQVEKLAALGKLAAGLAHELNNPAAAASRAADHMRGALLDLYRVGVNLQRYRFDAGQWDYLQSFQQEALRRSGERASRGEALSPLDSNDREERLLGWLEQCGVREGWKLAPTLVRAGLDGEELRSLAVNLPDGALADALAWVGDTLAVAELQNEIEQSTKSISDLVGAIKAYSHLDQNGEKEVDLHEGIESTLTMLNHKIKQGVTIVREYDRSLPRVRAFGNELNQVWTNLIDNAIDATVGRGTIVIRTYAENGHAVVEIADNGSGIPAELQCMIFEPFFTTKGQAKGAGLGLVVARRIVSERYQGEIYFRSSPGHTRFWVRLPLSAEPAAQPRVAISEQPEQHLG